MSTQQPSEALRAAGGFVARGYEGVGEAFRSNFVDRGEIGAGFCAYVAGTKVVDLWGGEARPGVPWGPDTMAIVFSTTKGVTALSVQVLADTGELDVDTPISEIWGEFAKNGKEQITLRHVLTHTSGVIDFPGYRRVIGDVEWWLDLDRIAADFAGAEPAWTPGTEHGYHGVSFGLIAGEVVRRLTGATLGSVFRALIGDRLGIDVWIGLPAEYHDRVAFLHDAPPPSDPLTAAYLQIFSEDTLTARAHFCDERGISTLAQPFNNTRMWGAEFPSGGAIASARGLAAMYAILAQGGSLDGSTIVSERSIVEHTAEQVRGQDLVLLFETRFALGYQRPTPFFAMGPADSSFGHGGLGGSLGMADRHNEVAAAYVMNQLSFPAPTEPTRAQVLIDALYEALPR